jgi:hypothetical protein
MGVMTTIHKYQERCEKLDQEDEIVRPDFNVQEMNYEVEMYSPDGEFLGSTKNDVVFADWRARIKRKGIHGYYIKVNGKTVTLDKNATPNMEIDGMFDAYIFSLIELV